MDKAHFEQLATRLRPKITALAVRFFAAVERAEQADDVAQETLLRLWRMTDKPTRSLLLRRYLDGDTTVGEEQSLAAYYRTASSVDADEREVAALLLGLDGRVLPPAEEPSVEGVSEFDRLLSQHVQPVRRPVMRRRVRLLTGCAVAAAVAVLGYFVLRPSDAPDALVPQSPSVAVTTTSSSQTSPSAAPVLASATAERAVSVPSRPQKVARDRRKPAHDVSTSASEDRVDLADVLKVASSSGVNVGIERKGNAFLVFSTMADGRVRTYIVDVSDASDMAVYALCDTEHSTAEYSNGGDEDVHGPNL